MARQIFILVPSDVNTSPISGAYALANGAVRAGREVTLVTLKRGTGASMPLERGVRRIPLHAAGTWPERRRAYREILALAGGRQGAASISMCFSADLVNSTCTDLARTICSIRGNLREGYRLRYGPPGLALARVHHGRLKRFDAVGAMSETMKEQIQRFADVTPFVAGNFIDEPAFVTFRREGHGSSGRTRFVCVGSLTHGKQPNLLLETFSRLCRDGMDGCLDFVGDGPLRAALEQRSTELGLEHRVIFHGFSSNPIDIVAQADVFVLPSLSEGISRASLEALFIGVPCVARAIDANGELIRDGENGALFHSDDELGPAMVKVASLSRQVTGERPMLIPPIFRQQTSVAKYLEEADQAD